MKHLGQATALPRVHGGVEVQGFLKKSMGCKVIALWHGLLGTGFWLQGLGRA